MRLGFLVSFPPSALPFNGNGDIYVFGFKLILIGTLSHKLQPKKVSCLHFAAQLHFLLELVASLSCNHTGEIAFSCLFSELIVTIPSLLFPCFPGTSLTLKSYLFIKLSNCEVLLIVFSVKDERLIKQFWFLVQ